MEIVKEGRPLPLLDSKDWAKFERAFRLWYRTSVKHEDEEIRAENKFCYTVAKDHVEGTLGRNITEVQHTGSLTINKSKSNWIDKLGNITKLDKTREFAYDISNG